MRHVQLTCKNHPKLRWSCKEIAWNFKTGRYNGARSLFPDGARDENGEHYFEPECKCPIEDLQLAPEDEAFGKEVSE